MLMGKQSEDTVPLRHPPPYHNHNKCSIRSKHAVSYMYLHMHIRNSIFQMIVMVEGQIFQAAAAKYSLFLLAWNQNINWCKEVCWPHSDSYQGFSATESTNKSKNGTITTPLVLFKKKKIKNLKENCKLHFGSITLLTLCKKTVLAKILKTKITEKHCC